MGHKLRLVIAACFFWRGVYWNWILLCDEEENGDENDAMPVISIGDILNASPFIELVIGQDDDEDEN